MVEHCSALWLGCNKGVISQEPIFFVPSIIFAWTDILCVKLFPVISSSSEWTDLVVLFWTFNYKNILCQM